LGRCHIEALKGTAEKKKGGKNAELSKKKSKGKERGTGKVTSERICQLRGSSRETPKALIDVSSRRVEK